MNELISQLHHAIRQRDYWNRKANAWLRRDNPDRARGCWMVGSTYYDDIKRLRQQLRAKKAKAP